MDCDGCGSKAATWIRRNSAGETCDCCGAAGPQGLRDVYFPGPYLDPHLIDTNDVRQKDGVWITSRRQKAEIMRKMGVREVGDRVGGERKEDRLAQRMEREKGRGYLPY